MRCRPETAPDTGSWRGTSNTVSRGLALIAEGVLDGDDASVDLLAERLGVGGRQLRRLFQQQLSTRQIARVIKVRLTIDVESGYSDDSHRRARRGPRTSGVTGAQGPTR